MPTDASPFARAGERKKTSSLLLRVAGGHVLRKLTGVQRKAKLGNELGSIPNGGSSVFCGEQSETTYSI